MANKELTYLQRYVHSSQRKSTLTKKTWYGLNLRQTVDSGMLSDAENISTEFIPYLQPCGATKEIDSLGTFTTPLGLFGFDDFLILINVSGGKVTFNKIEYDADNGTYSLISASSDSTDVTSMRSVVQFNVFATDSTILEGDYDRKIIVFPDKLSMPYEGEFKVASIETDGCAVPNLNYATVHLSRLFGVDDSRVYASGYNDYTNWNADTADNSSRDNAWFSVSQSNTRADGTFTGITTFQNHVVCFKKDFMHEIYNTANPFRIQDIYAEGTIDNRSICDVDGNLIFVSEDGVKVYTGGNPKVISYELGLNNIQSAVAGTDGRFYYLYCVVKNGTKETDNFFVYDIYTGMWSKRASPGKIIAFASTSFGCFALTTTGRLYKLNADSEYGKWYFETDEMTAGSVDIKRVDSLALDCNIENDAELKMTMIFSDGTECLLWESGNHSGHCALRVKLKKSDCYSFKIRVSGKGLVTIRHLELIIKGGGVIYV